MAGLLARSCGIHSTGLHACYDIKVAWSTTPHASLSDYRIATFKHLIMTATTNSDFNHQTEALQVAKAFPEQIRGKIILVTGVNVQGIGYATAEAFVSVFFSPHKQVR